MLLIAIRYFYSMFNSDFMESKQSKFFINELDPVILKLLVDFICTSQLTEEYVPVIFFYLYFIDDSVTI